MTMSTNVCTKVVKEHELQANRLKFWQKTTNCWWMNNVVGIKVDLFPVRADKQSEVAINVCSGCPHQVECLELSLTSKEEYGVWGGTTETERKEIIDRIYAEHEDTPRNLWNSELGDTIRRFAELNVEAFNREHGIDISHIDALMAERTAYFDSLGED